MKIFLFPLLFVLIIAHSAKAQNSSFKSTHQSEKEFYGQYSVSSDSGWDTIRGKFIPNNRLKNKSCDLNKIVFGWHPYWNNGLESNYDWTLLSDLSYFSYEVNSSTGGAVTTHNWATANVVTQALANGLRVNLCVTLFSDHATFFGSAASQQTLITNLINLVQSRGAHGVNIDFEGVPSSQKTNFTNFLTDLCNQMHTAIPGSQVSIALYAVDWSSVFDIPVLNNYIDLFIIMGYDYYYGGSTTAGPTSGLYSLTSSYNYNCSRSVNYYLYSGVSPDKLVLGLPYFGFEYATASSSVPSSASSSSTKIYKNVRANTSGWYIPANKVFNYDSYVPYYVYDNSGWYQCWMDDAFSLGKKFELVHKRGIAGIGIWALGYDDGYPELWDKIDEKLTTCRTDPCTDTIYDMGGPSWNHYDREDYTYTISPQGALSLSVSFQSFSLEADYDSLWLYDGPSTSSPLLGGFSGTTSPGTIYTTQPTLTLRFFSDNATTRPGYTALTQCITDNIPPQTSVSAPQPWITQDFQVDFTDSDNVNGTGIDKTMYNVSDFNGAYWSGNTNNGFFSDDFAMLQPQWQQISGVWNLASDRLEITDEILNNSNIYSPLNQNIANEYLYHFSARTGGSGTNRRFGFHFYCDSAQLSNRGNSYFVWFRVDDLSLQFYKVINDTFYLVETVSNIVTVPGQDYDFKVSFNRNTGQITAWRDNSFLGSWTDTSPHTTPGNYISFRSGNSTLSVDFLNVYISRSVSETVSVGSPSTDIRFQNPNPATPSGRISSIVTDNNNNLSQITSLSLNIDWTPPPAPGWINDGITNDLDTSYSGTEMYGIWQSGSDPNSGIAGYYYSFGTSPGDSSVTGNWIFVSPDTSIALSSLTLTDSTIYYLNVRPVNNAGLISASSSSDGILVLLSLVPPVTSFSADVTDICSGHIVNFTNQTTNATSYLWAFDGGSPATSTDFSPSVVYNSSGLFNVTLTANNQYGNSSYTIAGYISVNESPVAVYTVNNDSGPVPLVVLFTNQSTGADDFYWSFGDGTFSNDSNPFHIYSTPGEYVAVLIASNTECPADSASITIYAGISSIVNKTGETVNVFPNPASSYLFVSEINSTVDEIAVFSADGKQLMSVKPAPAEKLIIIRTENLVPGRYFMSVTKSGKSAGTYNFEVIRK